MLYILWMVFLGVVVEKGSCTSVELYGAQLARIGKWEIRGVSGCGVLAHHQAMLHKSIAVKLWEFQRAQGSMAPVNLYPMVFGALQSQAEEVA